MREPLSQNIRYLNLCDPLTSRNQKETRCPLCGVERTKKRRLVERKKEKIMPVLKKKPDPIQLNTCQNEKAVLFIFSFSFQEDSTCAP